MQGLGAEPQFIHSLKQTFRPLSTVRDVCQRVEKTVCYGPVKAD